MGGILKNPLPQHEQETHSAEPESVSEFRQQVLKNTRLNAQMTTRRSSDLHNGAHGVPKDTLQLKRMQDEERLQWNQQNLDQNELTKQQFQDIHVDEPKTPYQGAIDPEGEYYKHDDDDEDGDLENFTLGDPEYSVPEPPAAQNGQPDAHQEVDDDQAAQRRRFEEMRRKHYNIREAFSNRQLSDDEDE
ncbi:AaceriAGL341Cp [[Ashbya] aceris (nom. inval.)]|nr:AaceriAGL341Cp [[Ashbya] aceris (nom. inval.)]